MVYHTHGQTLAWDSASWEIMAAIMGRAMNDIDETVHDGNSTTSWEKWCAAGTPFRHWLEK